MDQCDPSQGRRARFTCNIALDPGSHSIAAGPRSTCGAGIGLAVRADEAVGGARKTAQRAALARGLGA